MQLLLYKIIQLRILKKCKTTMSMDKLQLSKAEIVSKSVVLIYCLNKIC